MQKLQLRQNQSQKLSPQQIQFIKLLQLSNSNIESEIKKELEENPALEENENKDNIEFDSSREYNYTSKSNKEIDYSKENTLSNSESFRENLLQQLNFLKLEKNELIIAKQIIGTLDNDGYLRRDINSIIDDIALTENIEFSKKEVENILFKIHKLEPTGIGARNLEECLILQIDELEDLSPTHKLSKKIITESFDEFKNKKFSEIYEKYPESKKEINESFNFIKTLNPKPSGGMEDLSITEYLIPDFIIKKMMMNSW